MEKTMEDVYITPQIQIINLSDLDVITMSGEIEDNLGDTWQS